MREINKDENKFYAGENPENPLAEIHWVPTGEDQIILDHSFVSEELRGEGMGEALVERVVDYAREEDKKVIVTCPFAKAQIQKHEDFQDVLAEDQ
ncbi:GNAT family N-acetyltransferase [Salimicrobium humidisoli]|uniref:GNAT family N-acetyltransferase n=1 Tax=Salimicrobium humidisoli TaxID=2029857 RepID=A0ABX4HRS0_9BACI|nr:GNAT family N-acetyltransferase [Salimicrobium humidisoli]PBB05529.1 GNAT family N-acetyltransferase [Salimicrobium humidisoli]